MAYSQFRARVYAGVSDSYFSDTRPAALMGNVQSIRLTEGQDASRPFQRFRPSRLDVETIIPVTDASDRPYQAGYLVWLQVEVGAAAAATWFRGLMLTPDYRMQRQGRSRVRFSALDLSDALNEEITVANQSNGTIAANFGLLLDGVGWPDDVDWRDIDADLIEQLSSWAHSSGKAIRSAQALVDTVGPPARMVIRRNGGMRVIKDVSDTVEASFTDADVRELPDLQQHEDSVINTVTIEGTTLGSIGSTVRNSRPLEYMVLDGLAATERVNVIRRILAAYQNGLTTLDLDFQADNDRNQASVAALEPGTVVELQSDFLGQTFSGPVSGLRWRWEKTRAFVRANVEVLPSPAAVVGVRLYMVLQFAGVGTDDVLFFLDAQTGLATQIDVGDPVAQTSLTYNPNANALYGALGNDLYLINTATGAGTLLHNIATFALSGATMGGLHGLTYDNADDVLIAVGQTGASSHRYMRIDLAAETIASIDINAAIGSNLIDFQGAAYNNAAGAAYVSGTDGSSGYLWRIEDDGTVALISNNLRYDGSSVRLSALAYDDDNQRLFGASRDGNLFLVDVATGTLTRIGTTDDFGLSGTVQHSGLGLYVARQPCARCAYGPSLDRIRRGHYRRLGCRYGRHRLCSGMAGGRLRRCLADG